MCIFSNLKGLKMQCKRLRVNRSTLWISGAIKCWWIRRKCLQLICLKSISISAQKQDDNKKFYKPVLNCFSLLFGEALEKDFGQIELFTVVEDTWSMKGKEYSMHQSASRTYAVYGAYIWCPQELCRFPHIRDYYSSLLCIEV